MGRATLVVRCKEMCDIEYVSSRSPASPLLAVIFRRSLIYSPLPRALFLPLSDEGSTA
jgi:hypothetical protein